MIVRSVDLTADIYKGEVIKFSFPKDSKVLLLSPDGTRTEYSFPFPEIDTSNWEAQAHTAIVEIHSSTQIKTFSVIDPMQTANAYNQYMSIINQIDLIIQSRIEGNAVIATAINNKSLTMESTDALLKIKNDYIKRVNQELKKIKNISGGNPIKSITNFNRRK